MRILPRKNRPEPITKVDLYKNWARADHSDAPEELIPALVLLEYPRLKDCEGWKIFIEDDTLTEFSGDEDGFIEVPAERLSLIPPYSLTTELDEKLLELIKLYHWEFDEIDSCGRYQWVKKKPRESE